MVEITVVNDMLSNLQKDIGNAFEFFVVRKRRFEDATNSAVGDADGSEVPELTLKFYSFSLFLLLALTLFLLFLPFHSSFSLFLISIFLAPGQQAMHRDRLVREN